MQPAHSCPRCEGTTESLKVFEFPQLIFYFFGASYRIDRVAACPSCLRRYLLTWGAKSLPLANFLWPVIIFPLMLCRFFASFLPSVHTGEKSVLQKIAGGLIGMLMVIAAFVFAFSVVALFKGTMNAAMPLFAISGIALILLGALGALVKL